jgi:ribonuclease P protein component
MRVSAGAWTAWGEGAPGRGGQLVVALGRTAGCATTRSRIRRIAREVFGDKFGQGAPADVLILARHDVSDQPRRRVRANLDELLSRLSKLLASRQANHGAHG